jgi:hypothetical protein
MQQGQLSWMTNFIWGIADDVLRDVYVRGKYRDVILLIPKLPAPQETDLAKGIPEAIDMDSYRAEVQASLSIALADQDAEIEPVPADGGGWGVEPELDKLSNSIKTFNDPYGNYA